MIKRIEAHSLLNGLLFSMVEFGFIAAVISPFAIYYIVHGPVSYVLVSVGIILNCLTVVALGIRQWKNKKQDVGWRQLLSKPGRERIASANPYLLRDTITITVTTLLPYVCFLLVTLELLIFGKQCKP